MDVPAVKPLLYFRANSARFGHPSGVSFSATMKNCPAATPPGPASHALAACARAFASSRYASSDTWRPARR